MKVKEKSLIPWRTQSTFSPDPIDSNLYLRLPIWTFAYGGPHASHTFVLFLLCFCMNKAHFSRIGSLAAHRHSISLSFFYTRNLFVR
ncbi:hypothetical protein L2E82_35436 [Cichorium intybus]|uniref:Uncharacterized protein n=1 Tax=Cichorium intybus TaxID=13427 RepID=A0ACB9BNU0_CICIN|nr:hypothetical protein L2E82_35436 [Cichorium intybus]